MQSTDKKIPKKFTVTSKIPPLRKNGSCSRKCPLMHIRYFTDAGDAGGKYVMCRCKLDCFKGRSLGKETWPGSKCPRYPNKRKTEV